MNLDRNRLLLIAIAALIGVGVLVVTSAPKPGKLGGRNCPYCRHYGPLGATHCARCEKWLPPPFLDPILREERLTDLWATKLLAAVSIVVFALEVAAAGGRFGFLTGVPASVLLRYGAMMNGIEWTEPWRFLAGCFTHMGVLHVGMNLLAFAELGRATERQLGGTRLVFSYVVTGIFGFIVSTAWYGYFHSPYVTAGASGAVFGLDGVLIGMLLAKKDRTWRHALIRTILHSFSFWIIVRTNQPAHLGGLAIGLLLGWAFGRESRPWRLAIPFGVVTVVSFAAIVTSLVLSAKSPIWQAETARERAREDAIRALKSGAVSDPDD